MKQKLIKRTLVLLAFVLSGIWATAQIPDELVLSLKTGNASTLSSYFNQNIELFVVDQDDVYSRAQAQQIVSNFFNQNKATGFSIIHQSGKEDTKYAIGKLTTNKGVFRVSFLVKNENGKSVIHQLRIEKE
ncbi:DUF4783 domain-containing protein [Mangrovibacterium diazotrophicum]|uniref:Uncharacterized protein DUF4783 n=1 Tax=Mangrovibacterium diazotrophicum TaxID=1261403 RepID=A0A419WBD1_9BACT|nr:DUF4783 domain-containing protein [Mangrovibacterium diazotrophicum]RKD92716.1 uncharacterized protein DUF4783 [Mangrovibacterium diazotrophicum]